MGSGTTCVAAIEEGRRYIGVEKDTQYYNIAVERIKEAGRQGRLNFE
jgi:DNA modification methylase